MVSLYSSPITVGKNRYFTRSNDFYLLSRRLEEEGRGQHPVINPLNVNIICVLAGELLLGAEDHHAVRPAALQGGGSQAEVHLQADGQGQKGGESFFLFFNI